MNRNDNYQSNNDKNNDNELQRKEKALNLFENKSSETVDGPAQFPSVSFTNGVDNLTNSSGTYVGRSINQNLKNIFF